MSEELNKQLVEILKSTADSVGHTKDFILAELPDVLQQTLAWYGVYNFILFIVGFLLIAAAFYSVYILYVNIPNKKENANKWQLLITDWYENDYVGVSPFILVVIFIQIVAFIISINLINLEWLKIWIAPKLWLIEYTTQIIK